MHIYTKFVIQNCLCADVAASSQKMRSSKLGKLMETLLRIANCFQNELVLPAHMAPIRMILFPIFSSLSKVWFKKLPSADFVLV